MGGGGSSSPNSGASGVGGSLAATYPVNTLMELKIAPSGTTIRGLVYCTDEISNSIVLKKSLVHTTLSSEITVINASSVMEKKDISTGTTKSVGKDNGSISEEEAKKLAGVSDLNELKLPLPNVNRKALEEREKRAIRLAEESFSHVNQRVSTVYCQCTCCDIMGTSFWFSMAEVMIILIYLIDCPYLFESFLGVSFVFIIIGIPRGTKNIRQTTKSMQ